MSWVNGKKSARAAIAREVMGTRDRTVSPERLRAIRDDTLSYKGTGKGGWTDEDIDDFAREINRHLRRKH